MSRLITTTIILSLLTYSSLKGQQLLTIEQCYNDAVAAHPLSSEKQLHNQLWQLKDKNIASGWYPKFDAGVSITYNTNVVDLGAALESLPIVVNADDISGMPRDQYKLTLDINQVIFDGGAIKNARELEKASLHISEQEVEIELYKIRKQVNNLFFTHILLKKQNDLLNISLEMISAKIKTVESAIENGILLPLDRDILKAEKVKLKQQIDETLIKTKSVIDILSDITDKDIPYDITTVMPEVNITERVGLLRPELAVFDLKIKQADAGKAILKSNRMPKAFGFATIGYGRPPGNDFFTDSFGPYAVVGAGFKWNIFDWNRSKRSDQIIDINKTILSSYKEEVSDNLKRALINKQNVIESIESMLKSDAELVTIRKAICKVRDSQLRNGTITASEYIVEFNAEKQALLNQQIHNINLVKAKVEYLNISGHNINK